MNGTGGRPINGTGRSPIEGTSDGRGILYPARLPTFHREPAPPDLTAAIRWFWIPRWNLAPGRVSRQQLLPFPASNLVVEPHAVTLFGPTTGVSQRDLRGTGWAIGVLLRPAGLAYLTEDPHQLRDAQARFDAVGLHREVRAAMGTSDESAGGAGAVNEDEEAASRSAAVNVFTGWAREHLLPPDETGLLANAMEDLIASDRSLVRIEQVSRVLGISDRSVQRLARRYVGLSPLEIIRRYRLQEAAHRLREDPSVTIATVAADLGYADHAHLTGDFRRVLAFTPVSYREGSG